MLTELAPAKINLTLEVIRKRDDGYHEIRSVMQTIGLCDRLFFETADGTRLTASLPGWEAGKSLVSRAVDLLRVSTGCARGVAVHIEKAIPLVSGLGGDSSNAAAILLGLDRLWGLHLDSDRLSAMAAQLGSDVPFFLTGGTMLAEGRGEVLAPLPPLLRRWVILVVPAVLRPPEKTARLYASLRNRHFTDGSITGQFITELEAGREPPPSLLFNTFENVVFTPPSEVGKYRAHLLKMGLRDVHLAGSGPTLFMLIADREEAEDLYRRCLSQKMEAYLVETAGPRGLAGKA